MLDDIINNPSKQKIEYNPHDATWEILKLVNSMHVSQIAMMRHILKIEEQLNGLTGQELDEKSADKNNEIHDKIFEKSNIRLNELLQKLTIKYHEDLELASKPPRDRK